MPQPTTPLFGILGSLRFIVQGDSLDTEQVDDYLYGYARENKQQIEREIRITVSENLGPDYEVIALELSQGSVVIDFAVATIGTMYVTISQYDDSTGVSSRYSVVHRRAHQGSMCWSLDRGGQARQPRTLVVT
jgi:hypothetical protein